ncbi:hypothetical protein N3K66_003629 [Trichothecium roseum]|uniref:Uncharacterized protein n=1 Tax=Trichothecium roseum TaxID=47278 RepID=A0ACC0V6N6_9HYPO|nr:hypothetical protein N3K66_003629 [Trichothecium roseum]
MSDKSDGGGGRLRRVSASDDLKRNSLDSSTRTDASAVDDGAGRDMTIADFVDDYDYQAEDPMITGPAPAGVPANLFDTVEQQEQEQVPDKLMFLPRTTYQPPVASPAGEPANLSNTAEQQQEQVPEELMFLPRTTYQPPAAPPAGARPDHHVHNDHEAIEAGEADDDASINVVFERSSRNVSICSSVSNFSCRYCKSLPNGGIHYPHSDDEDDGGYGDASAGGYPLGGYPAREPGPSAENDKDGADNGKNGETSHHKDKGVSDDKEGMSLPQNKESDIVDKHFTERKDEMDSRFAKIIRSLNRVKDKIKGGDKRDLCAPAPIYDVDKRVPVVMPCSAYPAAGYTDGSSSEPWDITHAWLFAYHVLRGSHTKTSWPLYGWIDHCSKGTPNEYSNDGEVNESIDDERVAGQGQAAGVGSREWLKAFRARVEGDEACPQGQPLSYQEHLDSAGIPNHLSDVSDGEGPRDTGRISPCTFLHLAKGVGTTDPLAADIPREQWAFPSGLLDPRAWNYVDAETASSTATADLRARMSDVPPIDSESERRPTIGKRLKGLGRDASLRVLGELYGARIDDGKSDVSTPVLNASVHGKFLSPKKEYAIRNWDIEMTDDERRKVEEAASHKKSNGSQNKEKSASMTSPCPASRLRAALQDTITRITLTAPAVDRAVHHARATPHREDTATESRRARIVRAVSSEMLAARAAADEAATERDDFARRLAKGLDVERRLELELEEAVAGVTPRGFRENQRVVNYVLDRAGGPGTRGAYRKAQAELLPDLSRDA